VERCQTDLRPPSLTPLLAPSRWVASSNCCTNHSRQVRPRVQRALRSPRGPAPVRLPTCTWALGCVGERCRLTFSFRDRKGCENYKRSPVSCILFSLFVVCLCARTKQDLNHPRAAAAAGGRLGPAGVRGPHGATTATAPCVRVGHLRVCFVMLLLSYC